MKQLLLIIVAALMSMTSYGQCHSSSNQLDMSIPSVAVLSIASHTQTINNANNQSTEIIQPGSSKESWINYSSIVASGRTNKITVNITNGTIPSNTKVLLKTGIYQGDGGGNLGLASQQIELSYIPQDLITNIGSCYTGTGIRNGHSLNYTWVSSDQIDDECTLTLTYTIASDL